MNAHPSIIEAEETAEQLAHVLQGLPETAPDELRAAVLDAYWRAVAHFGRLCIAERAGHASQVAA